jgi:vacuolar-type H+-ATPase subunit H
MDAQKEASNLLKDAEGKIASMVDEHEITKKAYDQANEIVAGAQKNAREIRLGTKEYADSILNKVEEILNDTLEVIKADRQELK